MSEKPMMIHFVLSIVSFSFSFSFPSLFSFSANFCEDSNFVMNLLELGLKSEFDKRMSDVIRITAPRHTLELGRDLSFLCVISFMFIGAKKYVGSRHGSNRILITCAIASSLSIKNIFKMSHGQ